jgi:hypothetical protein
MSSPPAPVHPSVIGRIVEVRADLCPPTRDPPLRADLPAPVGNHGAPQPDDESGELEGDIGEAEPSGIFDAHAEAEKWR